jgi:hypothetical protein
MQAPSFRAALYWTPARQDPLWGAGNAWLGRDPELGIAVAQPDIAGIAEATEAPRLYGLHATLRPPMRLATGWEEFYEASRAQALRLAPFDLPRLEVAEISGFLALRETAPCPALQNLADECVRATNPHRLPPTPAELAKRRASSLSSEHETLMARWGYPYVFQKWFFHITLTRRLTLAELAYFRPLAETHFAEALAVPRRVTEIAIFTQATRTPPAPFLVAERLGLGATP